MTTKQQHLIGLAIKWAEVNYLRHDLDEVDQELIAAVRMKLWVNQKR